MNRLLLILALALLPAFAAHRAPAYSYSATGDEPLLKARAALFAAVAKGDWTAAAAAVKDMNADIDYLDKNEDTGILAAFDKAIADKDAHAVRAAYARAAADEIVRRMNGARQNLDNYQVAKALVITANRFFAAIQPDLPPELAGQVQAELTRAAEAIGNPGVLGVGQMKPDPEDFDEARDEIKKALAGIRAPSE